MCIRDRFAGSVGGGVVQRRIEGKAEGVGCVAPIGRNLFQSIDSGNAWGEGGPSGAGGGACHLSQRIDQGNAEKRDG
eukprot:13631815-Alexandrium_andersonii.AAC.1